jgi:hypothetical protein
MPVSKANIIIGAGWLKIGSYGADESLMVNLGATQDGVEIAMDRDFVDIKADQYPAVIAKFEINRKVTIKTSLLESTLANLAYAWGYNPSTDIVSGQLNLTIPNNNEWQIMFLGRGVNGLTRRAIFWRGVSLSAGSVKYSKDGAVVIPVQFEILADTTKTGQELGVIIESTPDTTPPSVSSITPANGATGVSRTTTISVVFSENIQFETFKSGFTLKKTSDSTVVSGTYSYNPSTKTATFTPSSSLLASTQYTVEIKNVYDLEENKMTSTFTSSFTTGT